MKSLAALLFPAAAAALPSLNFPGGSSAGTGPDPSQITIAAASFSGNGCPQGTVSTSFSSDKTVVTFGFDAFQTYIGPGTAVADRTKNCQLHLTLNYPGGFQFAVLDSTYHGYAQLDTGVTGTFLSTYYFSQDATATTTTRTSISGGGLWAAGQVSSSWGGVERNRPARSRGERERADSDPGLHQERPSPYCQRHLLSMWSPRHPVSGLRLGMTSHSPRVSR